MMMLELEPVAHEHATAPDELTVAPVASETYVVDVDYRSRFQKYCNAQARRRKFWSWIESHWNDYVFAVGGLTFFVGLLPILLTPEAAVPLSSSIPTAACLWLFLFVYHHLHLRFALVTGTLSAIAWTLIALYRGL